MYKSKFIELNIIQKRGFRKTRSRLKKRILNGGFLTSEEIRRYHLKNIHRRSNKVLRSGHLLEVKETKTITIPDKFCLITNHDKSLNFLNKLEKDLSAKSPFNLTFLHTNSERIGLSASYLFDSIIKKYKKKWITLGYGINLKGYFSKQNKEVNNFLLAFGLPKTLGIEDGDYDKSLVDADYKSKFVTMIFEGSSKQDFEAGNASTELADYFDRCLGHLEYRIAKDSKALLASRIGEIIGNAEEHAGGEIVNWVMLGAFNKSTNICSFAIINFGHSIFETLSHSKSTAKHVLEEIQNTINVQKNIVEKTKSKFSKKEEEPLWNVMAIQDGISSRRVGKTGKSSTRGQGFMDILNFVETFGTDEVETEVAIISGRSKILVDFRYPIRYVSIPRTDEKRRKLVFNTDFDLNKKQDPSKVILMKHRFPGTIITGKFIINDKHLREKV